MPEGPPPPPPPDDEAQQRALEERRLQTDKTTRREVEAIDESFGGETLEQMSKITTDFGKNMRREVYNLSRGTGDVKARKQAAMDKLDSWDAFNRAMETSIGGQDEPATQRELRDTVVKGSTSLLRQQDASAPREPAQKLLDELKRMRGVDC